MRYDSKVILILILALIVTIAHYTYGSAPEVRPVYEGKVSGEVSENISGKDLDKLIRKSTLPVVVYVVYGETRFSRQLEETMLKLTSDYIDRIRVVKVDLAGEDKDFSLSRRLEIDLVPTMILFAGGKERSRLVGEDDVTRKEIDRMLEKAGIIDLPGIRCRNLYIGMLEHRHANWPHEPGRDNSEYHYMVRILFARSESGWESVLDCDGWKAAYPKKVQWTVAFDGRKLGNLKSEDVPDSADPIRFYARDKIHKPNIQYDIPKIGKLTTEFSGWLDYPYLRPLVLVSDEHYKDPQKWRPFKPDREQISRVMPLFRDMFRDVRRCIEGAKAGSYTSVPFHYSDSDITAFKSYRSISGDALISVGFQPERIRCLDGLNEIPEWTPQWFFLSSKNEVSFLGNRMRLVDAGDYDNDGNSEVIFWTGRYNRDGYIMFFDHLTKSAEYLWSYH